MFREAGYRDGRNALCSMSQHTSTNKPTFRVFFLVFLMKQIFIVGLAKDNEVTLYYAEIGEHTTSKCKALNGPPPSPGHQLWHLRIYERLSVGFSEAENRSLFPHTSVMPSMSVLLIIVRLGVKDAFCKRDGGKVGHIWGGNAVFMLVIMMPSKGAPSAHRKINKSDPWIDPLAMNFGVSLEKAESLAYHLDEPIRRPGSPVYRRDSPTRSGTPRQRAFSTTTERSTSPEPSSR